MSIVRRTVAPAPALDLAAFGPLAAWIEQVAESKSAPTDYVAMTLLVSAAGVVGGARWVSPWAEWREPAILWAMLVGSPSASKSPAMDALREPLAVVERDAAASWPEMRRAYETAKVAAEACRDDWESDARAAVKDGRQTPPKPLEADEPDAPQMPRVVITDATIEATAAILAGNPRGLVLWRDECSAWLGNLGKYGDGDRAFWLEAYGGRPYTVDRKKHPEPLRLEHVAVSIVGGIQPERLATLLMNGDDDGMAARFLLTWPGSVKPNRPRHRPNSQLVTRALGRLHRLAFGTDGESAEPQPVTLLVEPAALDVFQEWREQHHAASQSTSGLMASSLGKMPGQALRLALVLELLWWAAGPEGAPEPHQVSARALGAALDLIESYFKPMLTRVLGEAALPKVDRHATVLARAILSGRAERINAKEVRRVWRLPGLREGPALAAAIRALEEAGWLIPVGGRQGGTSGRQRSDYVVDPRVHGGKS
jgi:putative DNA primase/helicase